ncbi:gliding motility lipoprotein GldD [Rubrolithibacter danxiaensis]|uniref:gliding motility lipoprotein GldD n=1 Tax=Rubrolithibacter danxiaensis TaxID=3390805 RepID=UPI003BF8D869
MKNKLLYFLVPVLFMLMETSCGNDYSPKPRGYFRIKLPEKAYQKYDSSCPYSFDYPVYAKIVPDSAKDAKPCWIDVVFPEFNGRVHLSYQPVTSKKVLDELTEDARTFAFKHTVKATSIDEGKITYPDRKVYGIYYTIEGNTASSVQFFLTDSTRHYLRGALYFNEEPRIDSIQPVLDFVKKDINVMIKSFNWK